MSNDVEIKLSAARTRLILDKPFLGALVLRLPMVAGDPAWCKSTATDARTFYYNRGYINRLTLDETQFVLAHEALHCALSHFARRQHRVKRRWDLACDFAINPLLINEGLQPTPDALYMSEFEDMTAEEIYPNLDDNMDEEPQDQHLYDQPDASGSGGQGQDMDKQRDGEQSSPESDEGTASESEVDENQGGAPQPPPLSPAEQEQLSVQWQQRMAGAAQQAMQAGKMGDAMARMVDHLLQPQLPWRMLLARYMTNIARDDYSYFRPSRREGNAIFPSLRSSQLDVTAVIDTSGSIAQDEMEQFVSEVNAIKGQMRARITLLACDAQVSDKGPWVFEPWEDAELPTELEGGGGTDFVPAFDWVETQDQAPDLLIYFTDADGNFPQSEPAYPVLWLVKGKAKVPWGQRVQLN